MATLAGVFANDRVPATLMQVVRLGLAGSHGTTRLLPVMRWGCLGATVLDWQEILNEGSIGECGDVVAVADATIYYREELVDSLSVAGVKPRTLGSGDLVAAAVLAWGDDAPARLEGDFAYVATWQSTGRVSAARDPVGSRPLFFSQRGGSLAVASSPAALVRAGLARDTLNLDWLAELAGGTVNVGSESAFLDVNCLRQGERLAWRPNRSARVDSWWTPPCFTEDGTTGTSPQEAAMQLRDLLRRAVRERLDPHGPIPAIVTLSGGRDSPAVYAMARALAGDGAQSVSLSYPPGDAGREDETILDILGMVGGSPHWIDTTRIPAFSNARSMASARPDAFSHPYEGQTTAMAGAARSLGSRVVLNGLGGDTLFHAEATFLADLFLAGRWRDFAREWRAQNAPARPSVFFRWAILPRLGPAPRSFVAGLRGGRLIPDVWDAELPRWIAGSNVDQERIRERAWSEPFRRLGGSRAADRERRLMLLGPFAGRVIPEYCRLSLTQGVEQRSPLYDGRIIRFAATRPRSERQAGGDYKRLLRRAMEGHLPASVTGPRPQPTGFAGGYLRSAARRELPGVLQGPDMVPRSQAAGLVLAREYAEAVGDFLRTGHTRELSGIVFTALVECWLDAVH